MYLYEIDKESQLFEDSQIEDSEGSLDESKNYSQGLSYGDEFDDSGSDWSKKIAKDAIMSIKEQAN